MDTLDKNEVYVQKLMSEQYEKNLLEISKEYVEKKEKIDKEFISVFDALFRSGIAMQQEGRKGKIAVISIFNLKSSILTENYDIQINLYDENFYLDRKDIFAFWKPTFLMKYYKSDMEFYKEKTKHILGIGYEKLQEFRMQYCDLYTVLISKYCMEKSGEIVKLESYKQLEKWEETIITFGSYMDKGICIYPPYIGEGV